MGSLVRVNDVWNADSRAREAHRQKFMDLESSSPFQDFKRKNDYIYVAVF